METIKGEGLVTARETNLVNSLAGKFSGVQITSSGGQVGASSRIVIRGVSSMLGNNQPLFVIDGVPVDNSMTFGGGQNDGNGGGNGDSPLFYGGTANRAVDIDPANIENVSILKGASATALYGTRAANGVVLITTKSGSRASKPRFSYGFNIGGSEARLPELQKTYAQGVDGRFIPNNSSSWGPRIDTLTLNGERASAYDNAKEFFKSGRTIDHNFSIAGGTDKSNYFVSYSNKTEEGIVINNDLVRNNFLVKFSSQLSDKLEAITSVNYINTKLNNVTEGNGRASYIWMVYGAPPSYNLRGNGPKDYLNPNGTQRLFRTNFNNPYFVVDNNGMESNVNRFLPNLTLNYKITDWLTLTNRLGADVYTDERFYKEAIGTFGDFLGGRVYEDVITYNQVNNDVILQATKRFGDFGLSALIGSQVNDIRTKRTYTQGVSLDIPGFYNLSNASVITASTRLTQQRLIGVYSQVSADYKNMAFITATARNDWSSTLPIDNNSFFYPSISGSLVLTDAVPALRDNALLSFAKVRVGWAQIGNGTDPYNTQEQLFFQSAIGDGQRGNITSPYNGQNGFTLGNVIGNPNLKPERTNEIETGVEMQFFGDRVRVEASYYNRLSKDQIFAAPVAGSSGANSRIVNAGSIRNEGLELMLNFSPIRTASFDWNIHLTYTKNVNTVEELTDGVENIRLGGFTSPGIYIVRDQGYGVIWGSRYKRNEQGQLIIDGDQNSPRYGLPKELDENLGVIGNTIPDWLGGIRNTFSYNNEKIGRLALTAVVDIRQGGDILNLDNFYMNFWGVSGATEDRTGDSKIVYPGVIEGTNQVNNIEVPLNQNYWRNNWGLAEEEWVEDGSFVRLREVTFTYGLPTGLVKKTPFQDVNLSFTGRNLILRAPNFSGSDPETSLYGSANGQGFYNFITPGTIGWNAALNVTF